MFESPFDGGFLRCSVGHEFPQRIPVFFGSGQNIDDLFNLPAPAALRRGMNDWGQSRHGRPIDGTSILCHGSRAG